MREELAAACRKHAAVLSADALAGYEAERLLWALCLSSPCDPRNVDRQVESKATLLNGAMVRCQPNSLAQIAACFRIGYLPHGSWLESVRMFAQDVIVNYCNTPMPEEVLKG